MDQRVLHVQGVCRDDALDEVLFAATVQCEPETAAEHGAALGDEGRERIVDVLLARETGITGGRKAASGKAIDSAGTVEVHGRLEALTQSARCLEHSDEGDRRLVGDAVHQREVAFAVLGLVVGEDLGGTVDVAALGK